jgi:ATP-dependent DNA ligase
LYQEASNLCKYNIDEEKWKKAVFWVFDVPEKGDKPFEERIEYLREVAANNPSSFVKVVDTVKCKGMY